MRPLILLAKCFGGGLSIVTGTALLVLPGPGIPLILLGLGILGSEFAWAARLRDRLAAIARRAWRRALDRVSANRAT